MSLFDFLWLFCALIVFWGILWDIAKAITFLLIVLYVATYAVWHRHEIPAGLLAPQLHNIVMFILDSIEHSSIRAFLGEQLGRLTTPVKITPPGSSN